MSIQLELTGYPSAWQVLADYKEALENNHRGLTLQAEHLGRDLAMVRDELNTVGALIEVVKIEMDVIEKLRS